MNPQLQSIVALAIVALVVAWFGWRTWSKRKQPGCGGDCGCPASDVKTAAKSRRS